MDDACADAEMPPPPPLPPRYTRWPRHRIVAAALAVALAVALILVVALAIAFATKTTAAAAPDAVPTSTPTATTVPAPAALEDGVRAMYLWDEAPCLLPTPGADGTSAYSAACDGAANAAAYRATLVRKLRAPWGGAFPAFTRIWLGVTPAILVDRPANVRALLAELARAGIAVELLAGEAAWLLSDADAATAVALCEMVAAFNRGGGASGGRFDGVHYDIEPHTLPDWAAAETAARGTDPYNDEYEDRLIGILAACRAALNPLGARVGWDMPYWYFPSATDLWPRLAASDDATCFADYLTLLNYVSDTYEFVYGINDTHAGGLLPVLGALAGHTPVVAAAELDGAAGLPAWETFWPAGSAAAEATWAAAAARAGALPGFAGIAAHYYIPYFSLPPAGPLPPATCTVDAATSTVTVTFGRTDTASVGVYARAPVLGGLAVLVNSTIIANGTTAVTLVAAGAGTVRLEARLFDGPGLAPLADTSVISRAACTV